MDHLTQALADGLMFTRHKVQFRPADAREHWEELLEEMHPLLKGKLRQLGKPWESLAEERRRALMFGLGSMTADMPMICLTEVPNGREVTFHQYQYGRYGLFIRREWLERQGADRVLYLGERSAVTLLVYRLITLANILGLHLNQTGDPLFENMTSRATLDLLAYVETRGNLEELEWRIAGRHEFMGGDSDVGKRLPLRLEDVEMVLVEDPKEVQILNELLRNLSAQQSTTYCPPVKCSAGDA
ncbi:hypothetical protein J7I44_05145 [Frateuria sp. MAH-13]|uniref:DUF4194 domain-containing protein n=1 Tax=Frateuria flava TaxID=2821489 RepID=A0ABS4DKU1_9GAMM|nr:abortive infection system antitoxin AbiGi family protein [Frateuria flava]MBP1473675.1 hypothetical protein [Frateuria flava]